MRDVKMKLVQFQAKASLHGISGSAAKQLQLTSLLLFRKPSSSSGSMKKMGEKKPSHKLINNPEKPHLSPHPTAGAKPHKMSGPNPPAIPARPSSASLTTTATTASTSPPTTRSTLSPPTSTTSGLAAPASSSSLSTPPSAAAAARIFPTGATRPLAANLPPQQHLHPTASQTAQARDALVASLGNALDVELSGRAMLLHGNARALAAQERDVSRALEELRREDDKLLKVLGEGSRKVKELGDVQNWAERLERDFLVVEETMRLVAEGSGSEGSWSGSESGSWSGSERRSERGSVAGDDEEEDVRMSDSVDDGEAAEGKEGPGMGQSLVKGKGKQVEIPSPDAMDVDPVPNSPLQTDTSQDSGSSSVVTAIKAPDQDTSATASPTPSPGANSWLKRFIWRS